MPEANDQSLEKILEEHTQKVYELYQNKSNSFQKTFRLLFSFALLFLFIILIPFVTIRMINHQTAFRQENLKKEISQKQEILETYKNIQHAIDKVHSDLKNQPSRLRDFILSAPRSNIQSPMIPQQNMVQQQPIQIPSQPTDLVPELTSMNERVKQEVQQQFEAYDAILQSEVLEPLKSLNNDQLVVIDLTRIGLGLDSLKNDFTTELAQNPHFWETFSGKGGFYSTLDDKVQHFWDIHGSQIDHQSQVLQLQYNELQESQKELTDQLNKMKEEEKQVAARLDQIEFPFGKLPVGLTESIAIFPIILAIGFLVVASQLRETIQLRKSFHQLYQRKDPTRTVLNDQQIALIAPLWIDPENTNKQKLARLIILSIPFVIFIISCILIFYNWSIPGFFAYADQLNWWLYGGLYVVSLLIFIYGYRQILNELRDYSSH